MLPLGRSQRSGRERGLRWQHTHRQNIGDANTSLPIIARIWVHNDVSLAVARTESLSGCIMDLNSVMRRCGNETKENETRSSPSDAA